MDGADILHHRMTFSKHSMSDVTSTLNVQPKLYVNVKMCSVCRSYRTILNIHGVTPNRGQPEVHVSTCASTTCACVHLCMYHICRRSSAVQADSEIWSDLVISSIRVIMTLHISRLFRQLNFINNCADNNFLHVSHR